MKKKRINLIVTLIVAIALIATTTVFASAATVKINKKSLSLYAGKTSTVKVLNASKKVTWTSSKKTVATIKSTGRASAKITAKKAGTTTITGRIGSKKYTCKVTVKYATGSRQKPGIATDGVTVTDYNGRKMYFKVDEIYKGDDAMLHLKSIGNWDSYNDYEYENKDADSRLVIFRYQVKALSGFDEDALSGFSIIDSFSLYNGTCSASIDDFDTLLISKNSYNDLSLYDGAEGTMYFAAFIPNDISSFSNYIYSKGFSKYWIKYTF